jgi:hypothetical protein
MDWKMEREREKQMVGMNATASELDRRCEIRQWQEEKEKRKRRKPAMGSKKTPLPTASRDQIDNNPIIHITGNRDACEREK